MDLEYTGPVRKMESALADPVSYSLPIGDYSLSLDNIIGNSITDDNVIRGELIVDEGDPYSVLLLDKSINNLNYEI